MNERNQHLQFVIGRFDHFYESINSKVQFYLGLNTFYIGSVVAGLSYLQSICPLSLTSKILFYAATAISFGCVLLAILATRPYVRSGNHDKYNSLIFFGSIAKIKCDSFHSNIIAQDEEMILQDMCIQAHQLARGLRRKFRLLELATWLLLLQFVMLIAIGIVFIDKN